MASLSQSLTALDLEPLWERTEGGLRPAPVPETPQHWRWSDIEPLIDRVIDTVPMEHVERRVLTLKNPDPRYRLTTTIRSINCGIQILMPGETAPPHRHSPNALRVALEGEGGETTVNGVAYEMNRGDVILTPSGTLHAHAHCGSGRVIWIDFLDVPFFRNLDLIFFEPGEGAGGTSQVGQLHQGALPVGRFPWFDVATHLAAADDGQATYDYIDPVVGESALSMLDCTAIGLGPGETRAERPCSASSVCLVLEGAGESRIGDATISWTRNDVFTLPQWLQVQHRAGDGAASIIRVSDRPALRRLGLLQDGAACAIPQTD